MGLRAEYKLRAPVRGGRLSMAPRRAGVRPGDSPARERGPTLQSWLVHQRCSTRPSALDSWLAHTEENTR